MAVRLIPVAARQVARKAVRENPVTRRRLSRRDSLRVLWRDDGSSLCWLSVDKNADFRGEVDDVGRSTKAPLLGMIKASAVVDRSAVVSRKKKNRKQMFVFGDTVCIDDFIFLSIDQQLSTIFQSSPFQVSFRLFLT
jgi:hypothetical protein